ncbi:MAG TPA: glycogen debranching enzyme, partial [Candidatus Dormibacteraeota bacterium]|nr:glycogen debranching enzyme [Candidatus Dormibacteraeota bacterium]
SYNQKHNEANGDDNRDGENFNRSWNCGVEGPSEEPEIRALRDRQKRNLLATLLLSQGVPMLLGGDDIGRTQRGNNNAYCQDNATSWFDWESNDGDLHSFVARLIQLRRDHPVFRRRRWFQGREIHGEEMTDVAWFKPDGGQMTLQDWQNGFARSLAVFLNGEEIASPDHRGRRVRDDSFFILFNAHDQPLRFTLPRGPYGRRWMRALDTADPLPRFYRAGGHVPVVGRSLVLLRRVE